MTTPSGRFCPYCGTTNPSDYRFCLPCQHALPVEAPAPPRAAVRTRRRWVWGSVVLGVAVAIVLAALLTVPVGTAFSLTVSSSLRSTPSTVRETFPAGARVSFQWNTTDGGSVTFSVVDPSGTVVAQSSGASGSGAFVAAGGAYGFRSASVLYEVVDVSGTYVAPLVS